MSVRAGAWLAVRELRARWPRMLLAAAVVAALSGAAVTMELLARAREEVVAARIDSMGPPLTIVPAGTTAEALGRYDLGEALLPSRAAADAAAELGPALRLVEARLVLGTMMEGRRVPLVGLPRGRWPGDLPPASGILAGAELGRSMPVGTSSRSVPSRSRSPAWPRRRGASTTWRCSYPSRWPSESRERPR